MLGGGKLWIQSFNNLEDFFGGDDSKANFVDTNSVSSSISGLGEYIKITL